MNGYFPHHIFQLNFVRNPCSVGFIHPPSVSAQYVSPGHAGQFALAQHQLQTGLTLASLPPHQQLQLRAQLQGVGRVLLQQQFLQNYSFTNSSCYHQIPQAQSIKKKTLQFDQVDPAYSVVCANIKDEIWKQLSGDYRSRCPSPTDSVISESVESVSRETSRETSPSSTRSPSAVVTESTMESRGLKYVSLNHLITLHKSNSLIKLKEPHMNRTVSNEKINPCF